MNKIIRYVIEIICWAVCIITSRKFVPSGDDYWFITPLTFYMLGWSFGYWDCSIKVDNRIVAVDFDGTLCENRYPSIGKPNEKLINHLKKRRSKGAKLILWTCRRDKELENAVEWCKGQGLIFDAVVADKYIDDKNYNNGFTLPFWSNNLAYNQQLKKED